MWTDISQFDIPDHQKTTAYGSSKVGKFTDIGEVCVVNSMFGKAKVRVIPPRKKRSFIWPLAALTVMGMAVAFWLEQDIPKPPEPMRIIVRPVASESTMQTSSQTLQGSPAINSNAPLPPVPVKPQTSPGSKANSTIVAKPVIAQPVLPLVKSEPATTVPPAKQSIPVTPQTTPLAEGNIQAKNPAVVQQAAKPPAPIQSAAQPVAAQASPPVIRNEKPAITPVAEPLPDSNTKTMAPASSTTPPDQTGTKP
jgi:hypothetical protein